MRERGLNNFKEGNLLLMSNALRISEYPKSRTRNIGGTYESFKKNNLHDYDPIIYEFNRSSLRDCTAN